MNSYVFFFSVLENLHLEFLLLWWTLSCSKGSWESYLGCGVKQLRSIKSFKTERIVVFFIITAQLGVKESRLGPENHRADPQGGENWRAGGAEKSAPAAALQRQQETARSGLQSKSSLRLRFTSTQLQWLRKPADRLPVPIVCRDAIVPNGRQEAPLLLPIC